MSIQAQVLNLLKQLQRELGLTYVFVAHNMGVVEHISDRVAVMYLGRIAELADRRELFRKQEHPVHRRRSCRPSRSPTRSSAASGSSSRATCRARSTRRSGCRFHPRCQLRQQLGDPAICADVVPPLIELGDDHQCACHFRQPAAPSAVPAPQDATAVPAPQNGA